MKRDVRFGERPVSLEAMRTPFRPLSWPKRMRLLIELLDYTIGELANVALVAGGFYPGLSLAEYLDNLKQSRTFADNHIEVPCVV